MVHGVQRASWQGDLQRRQGQEAQGLQRAILVQHLEAGLGHEKDPQRQGWATRKTTAFRYSHRKENSWEEMNTQEAFPMTSHFLPWCVDEQPMAPNQNLQRLPMLRRRRSAACT